MWKSIFVEVEPNLITTTDISKTNRDTTWLNGESNAECNCIKETIEFLLLQIVLRKKWESVVTLFAVQ